MDTFSTLSPITTSSSLLYTTCCSKINILRPPSHTPLGIHNAMAAHFRPLFSPSLSSLRSPLLSPTHHYVRQRPIYINLWTARKANCSSFKLTLHFVSLSITRRSSSQIETNQPISSFLCLPLVLSTLNCRPTAGNIGTVQYCTVL